MPKNKQTTSAEALSKRIRGDVHSLVQTGQLDASAAKNFIDALAIHPIESNSAKSNLKSLGALPVWYEISATVEHLGADLKDRELAIVAASLLDTALMFSLQHHLNPLSNTDREGLFDNNGPLYNFLSKIILSKALKLISPSVNSDLTKVRQIRNLFAHSLKPISFTSDPIAKVCQNFSLPITWKQEYKIGVDFLEQIGLPYISIADEKGYLFCQVPIPSEFLPQHPKALFITTVQLIWMLVMTKGVIAAVPPKRA